MGEGWRRFGDADAMYVPVDAAVPGEFAPVSVSVYASPFPDEHAVAHLREVMTRLLPQLRCRIVRDPFSPALPRWVEVPGFDAADHMVELPAPGDATLRAVLDWAAEWGVVPMRRDRPPWRQVFFRDVEVDGVRRMVSVGQMHHAVIDGEGGRRLGERFLQWGPDEPMPEMPPVEPPERRSAATHWREGWAAEGRRALAVARAGAERARWVAGHPRAGLRRARELAGAVQRFNAGAGKEPMSDLLRRRSERLRFDLLEVDVPALKAGARTAGGTVNDGFLAAMALALRAWHLDHGVTDVDRLRTAMAVNTRPEDAGHHGNDITSAMLFLPLDDDDPAALVARCHEVSLAARTDRDVMRTMDRARALANRMPTGLTARAMARSMRGLDLQVSNVNGVPAGYWLGGVQNLATYPFPASSWTALQLIMATSRDRADLAITTCPVTFADPAHLLGCIEKGFADVVALAAGGS